jgi:polysaccharide export outer membrane protein
VKKHTTRTRSKTLAARGLACILAISSGAVSAQSSAGVMPLPQLAAQSPPVSPQSAPADYIVGSQDVLQVQLFDQPDLGGKYTVEADGTFSFPLIGRVAAGGLTLRKVESELRTRLADGYFINPQIIVSVEQYRSRRVFVMGEVRTPGPVSLTGEMTLIEALARAGSTLPSASGEIGIVRAAQGREEPVLPGAAAELEILHARIRDLESGRRNQNIDLQDGDTIFVPRAESVYVFGEVRTPGAYVLQNDTTVLQALSLAGGVSEDGAMNRIKIVRLVNGLKSELKANLGDRVQPGDTVIIPRKYF